MIIGTILVIMSAYFCANVNCAEKRKKESFTNLNEIFLKMWIAPLLIAVGFGGIILLLVIAEKDGF